MFQNKVICDGAMDRLSQHPAATQQTSTIPPPVRDKTGSKETVGKPPGDIPNKDTDH